MWYVLAAANALSGDSELIAGTQLRVPEVGVSKNDASTFKPYNPNDIVGSTAPGLPYIPPASSSGCGPVVTLVLAAIATAVSAIVAPYITPYIAQVFGVNMTIVGAATAAQIAVGAAGAFVGGMAGSIASQVVGSALGANSFSLRNAVSAGLSSGLTFGLTAGLGGSTAELMKGGLANAGKIAVSLVGNASIGYASNALAGVKGTSFSWKAIAANVVASGITAGIEVGMGNIPVLKNGMLTVGNPAGDFINNAIGGVVSLHTRRAFGFNDKVDYGNIMANALGSALGSAAGGAITVKMAESAANKKLSALKAELSPAENQFVNGLKDIGVSSASMLNMIQEARIANIDLGAIVSAGSNAENDISLSNEFSKLITIRDGLDQWAKSTGLLDQIQQAAVNRDSPESVKLYNSNEYTFYTATAYALLAKDVYFNEGDYYAGKLPSSGIIRLSSAEAEHRYGLKAGSLNTNDSYNAAVYYDSLNDRAVYVNRGTQEGIDWRANMQQALGYYDPQYQSAFMNATIMAKADTNVVFVGHSLGGGLASLQALATNKRAYTYNAAGLSDGTVDRYKLSDAMKKSSSLVSAYYVAGDVLSGIQDLPTTYTGTKMDTLSSLQSAAGQRIPLMPNGSPHGYHFMATVITSFGNELDSRIQSSTANAYKRALESFKYDPQMLNPNNYRGLNGIRW